MSNITSKDVFEAISNFRTENKEQFNRLDDRLQKHGEDIAAIKEHLKNQNGRIGKVEENVKIISKMAENNKLKLYGFTVVVPTVVTILTIAGAAKALGFW